MPHRRDAVDVAVRESARRVREPWQFRDGLDSAQDEDDLEHMKSKGDIDFVESSIENARAQVTNVEKVTRTLESLHNEMHDFEDRIFFLEHVQLCKMVLDCVW